MPKVFTVHHLWLYDDQSRCAVESCLRYFRTYDFFPVVTDKIKKKPRGRWRQHKKTLYQRGFFSCSIRGDKLLTHTVPMKSSFSLKDDRQGSLSKYIKWPTRAEETADTLEERSENKEGYGQLYQYDCAIELCPLISWKILVSIHICQSLFEPLMYRLLFRI